MIPAPETTHINILLALVIELSSRRGKPVFGRIESTVPNYGSLAIQNIRGKRGAGKQVGRILREYQIS
jgi:hypothetical protein